jgi:hypothetical protein
MRPRFAALLIALSLLTALLAFDGFPRLTSVEPDTGKTGDVVSAKGENLDKSSIAELYLTTGSKDTKVQISEQTDKEIKFKVPQAQPGRYHLLVLTANKQSLIEQPVIFTVE